MPLTPRWMSITRKRDLLVATKFYSSLSNTERVAGLSLEFSQVLPGSKSGRMYKGLAEVTLPHEINNAEVSLSETARTQIDASLVARSTRRFPFASQQTHSFHTSSSHLPCNSTSYNITDVPDFFVKYKQHRATFSEVHRRTHDDLGLMQSLTDSILSGDVVASTRRLKAKIPVEHHVTEGRIIHPSGFVVPGPGYTSTSDAARAKERERNEKRDRLVQTAAVAHRVLESDFGRVEATTLPSSHKVPFEVRESDGSIKHPSGFVPPTPAHKFRYTINSDVLRNRKVSGVHRMVR